MTLDKKERGYLLKLARQAVGLYLQEGRVLELRPAEVSHRKLVADCACFVTLRSGDGQLRGCIGTLEANRPLVFDVIGNALSAAFEDPRFRPLSPDELPGVKFSISVLSRPVPLQVKAADDLLGNLSGGEFVDTPVADGRGEVRMSDSQAICLVQSDLPDEVHPLRRKRGGVSESDDEELFGAEGSGGRPEQDGFA